MWLSIGVSPHFPFHEIVLSNPYRMRSLRNPPVRRISPVFIRRLSMSEQEQAEIRLEFAKLKQEHADFDAAISAMIAVGCDPIQIQRMKKKKLLLKDRLLQLEDRIIPDIIA
jgi:hypothetical protein